MSDPGGRSGSALLALTWLALFLLPLGLGPLWELLFPAAAGSLGAKDAFRLAAGGLVTLFLFVLPFARPGGLWPVACLLVSSAPGLGAAALLTGLPAGAVAAGGAVMVLSALAGTLGARLREGARGVYLSAAFLLAAAGPFLEAAFRDLGAGDWPLGTLSPYVWLERALR